MQTSLFRGSRTVMSLRLCSRAPWITSSSAAITGPVYRCEIGRTSVRFRCSEAWRKAGPGPLLGPGTEAGADGVEADVVDGTGQVLVCVERRGPVAVAEEVAAPPVAAVEAARVGAVQPVHAASEVGDGRPEDEVVVRCHQAVGVELPAVALDRVGEERKERAAVDAVPVDRRV